MKKWIKQQNKLVWHNGVLKWKIREVYKETISPPWYKFWKQSTTEITYSEPKYVEVPKVNDE